LHLLILIVISNLCGGFSVLNGQVYVAQRLGKAEMLQHLGRAVASLPCRVGGR